MNKIRISGRDHHRLKEHLFPGDGKEAVAIALCGRSVFRQSQTLVVQELFLIPHEACIERRPDFVHWPTDIITHLIDKAAKYNLGLLKIHCHPEGYEQFSKTDDESDHNLFSGIHAWLDDDKSHASCVMLPSGKMFGRFFHADMTHEIVHQISVAGSDVFNWYYSADKTINEQMHSRNLQVFGKKTIQALSRMKVGVVGCSGTGSPVIEQLKRLGVGELVLVDPDFIDHVNLNRIVGSTFNDAEQKTLKVDVMKRGIEAVGFETKVTVFPTHISQREVVKELADCDFLIGGVDGTEGRHILNLISSHYIVPYIDLGVRIDADGQGGISGVYGTVHFIQPGGSSLLSRGQYTIEQLRAESIKRTNKEEYEKNRYLTKVNESSPAVISINMQVAATAINEFLARIHPYRNIDNKDVDAVKIMFNDCATYPEQISEPCPFFAKMLGKGDIEPLINNPELSYVEEIV